MKVDLKHKHEIKALMKKQKQGTPDQSTPGSVSLGK
jgi:hypothetical protein